MKSDKLLNVKSELPILEHPLLPDLNQTRKRGWLQLLDYHIISIPPFRCCMRGWSRRSRSLWHSAEARAKRGTRDLGRGSEGG
jgi:hypothetical protein